MILAKLKSEHHSRGRAKYGAALESIWKRCREDAKTRFRQPSIKIHLDQVHRLVASVMREPGETQKEMIAGARKLSILPIDPASVLSEDNAVVVGRLTRNEALLALKKRGVSVHATLGVHH
jgi:hypothetical protein